MVSGELEDLLARRLSPTLVYNYPNIEALADYLRAKVIGRGPVTRAECFETLGERVRSCNDIPGP